MTILRSGGVSVDVPTGWDAEFYSRPPDGGTLSGQAHLPLVLHMANFALPIDRGDFGSNVVETMGRGDVLIVLLEFGPDSAGQPLFWHEGIPLPLYADSFAPSMLQRPLPGQGGTQRFFSAAGRPYCLYVVLGDYAGRASYVGPINAVLDSVRFT